MLKNKGQILIIDDDPGICTTLCDILEDEGYEVRDFKEGRKALDFLKKKPFGVVFIDIKLPDIDGMALLEQIKLINPESAVIIITGNASTATAIEALNEGAYAYLVKPFNVNELKAVIRKALREIRLSMENKKLIDQLQCSNRDLEKYKNQLEIRAEQLKSVNGELESTIEKLNQSNKRLQEFVYVVSHDLREPLWNVFSFGQLLTESLEGKLNDDEKENLGFMINGAERMQQMIESLLAYSRITTQRAEFTDVDLNEILNQLESVELAHRLQETKGKILIPDDLQMVKGDPVQIRQLLQNLISNALKYCRKGVSPRITIRAYQQDGGMVRIGVEDNGIGIKPEHYNSVFFMFRRLLPDTDSDSMGIGLSICKRIVELHKGEIGVDSIYGCGSTFWFTLPVAEGSPNEQEKAVLNFEV